MSHKNLLLLEIKTAVNKIIVAVLDWFYFIFLEKQPSLWTRGSFPPFHAQHTSLPLFVSQTFSISSTSFCISCILQRGPDIHPALWKLLCQHFGRPCTNLTLCSWHAQCTNIPCAVFSIPAMWSEYIHCIQINLTFIEASAYVKAWKLVFDFWRNIRSAKRGQFQSPKECGDEKGGLVRAHPLLISPIQKNLFLNFSSGFHL